MPAYLWRASNHFIVNSFLSLFWPVLISYFRQLILPWLIALSLMLLFTAVWYRYEARLQQRTQVTQLLAALQVSIRPFLHSGNYEQLTVHLEHARFSSPLTVDAIVLFNEANQPLVTSGKWTAVTDFVLAQPLEPLTFQDVDHQVLAIQPLAALPLSLTGASPLPAAAQQYYLAVLVSPQAAVSVWLLPVAIVALLGLFTLIVLYNTARRGASRRYTDISLLVHKLHQLRQGQTHSRINEDLVPELLTLKEAINTFADSQLLQSEKLHSELEQNQQQLAEIRQQHTSLLREHAALKKQHSQDTHTLQQWLFNLQKLMAQADQLSASDLLNQIDSQLSLMLYRQQTEFPVDSPQPLSEWLAGQVPIWSEADDIELIVFEAADTVNHQLIAPITAINTLLNALIYVSKHAEQVTELTVRAGLHKHTNSYGLQVSVTSNGLGISRYSRALIESGSIDKLQWHDSNIGLVMLLAEKLEATLDVQSLEGLGTTLTVQIPVAAQAFSSAMLGNLLVLDVNAQRLTERKPGFGAIALNTLYCSDLTDLELKSSHGSFDLIVVFLPEPQDLANWQTTLRSVADKNRMLCCSDTAAAAIWQETLAMPVQARPFCLADITQRISSSENIQRTTSFPRLLVVDDNPTNLAFITVLMKGQPLELVTVTSGTEALQICAEQNFDIILLDIQLPDINGTEVAKRLRQLPAYQQTPILAFTAHALKHEIDLFLRSGMNDVIFKPLEVDKLQTILRWCSVKHHNISQQQS